MRSLRVVLFPPGSASCAASGIAVALLISVTCIGPPGQLGAQSITGATPIGSLGSPETFGSIDDVALLAHGQTVVLDRLSNVLRLFDSTGAQVDSAGGPGGGPGEFRHMVGMDVLNRDHIVVVDPVNARLTRVAVSAGSLAILEEHRLDFSPTAFCVLGGDLYFVGLRHGMVFHRADAAGRVLESFMPVADEGPVQVQMRARGKLACEDAPAQLAFASSARGTVEIFSPTTNEFLIESILDYSGHEITGDAFTVRRSRPRGGAAHSVARIAWLGHGLLVQLRRTAEEQGEDPTYEFRYYDSIERTWQSLGGFALPSLVAVSGDSLAFTKQDLPFPRIQVWRLHRSSQ